MVFLIIITFSFFITSFGSPNEAELQEQLYVKLFKRRRAEQLEAVKSFRKLPNYEKQHLMIQILTEKIFSTIASSRATVEGSGYVPGLSPFPEDEKLREALSNILENTALFGEITLRFPDIAIEVLRANNTWDVLFQWGIGFANLANHLLDKSTVKLLSLVSQELNHTERDPNYRNPYRKTDTVEVQQSVGTAKKKKTKAIKKGPKLSPGRIEL